MLVYQLTTIFPLCGSKAYCPNLQVAKERLALVIHETEIHRKCQTQEEREKDGIKSKKVMPEEMEAGARLLKIDIQLLGRELEDMFGPSRPIEPPKRRESYESY